MDQPTQHTGRLADRRDAEGNVRADAIRADIAATRRQIVSLAQEVDALRPEDERSNNRPLFGGQPFQELRLGGLPTAGPAHDSEVDPEIVELLAQRERLKARVHALRAEKKRLQSQAIGTSRPSRSTRRSSGRRLHRSI